MAILDCVTSCLRKTLVKEQTTICTDNQVGVTARGASETKSLLVADCIKKNLTALSEVNQVTIIWVPVQDTTNRLASEGARTRLIRLEPFLQLSLLRFNPINWTGKKKQTEWKIFERYETSQLFLEGPTDRYV